jgi:hypothetical protein
VSQRLSDSEVCKGCPFPRASVRIVYQAISVYAFSIGAQFVSTQN